MRQPQAHAFSILREDKRTTAVRQLTSRTIYTMLILKQRPLTALREQHFTHLNLHGMPAQVCSAIHLHAPSRYKS